MSSDAALVSELSPTLERLVDRHLATTKEWFPHELVPWERARAATGAHAWDADDHPLPDAVRSALFVNLLTEDNLPYYFATIDGTFGSDDVWGAWARRWTAEEGRHSIVMRDYLTVTGLVDPVALERARMHQVSHGVVPEPAHRARRPGLRRPPGAGHPHRPPRHRQAARRQGRLRRHGPGGRRREPAPPALPRPGDRGDRDRPVGRRRWPSSAR